eukprot:965225-Pyramimonas_sp.AAC.1
MLDRFLADAPRPTPRLLAFRRVAGPMQHAQCSDRAVARLMELVSRGMAHRSPTDLRSKRL